VMMVVDVFSSVDVRGRMAYPELLPVRYNI
jgi:hypothetical protein